MGERGGIEREKELRMEEGREMLCNYMSEGREEGRKERGEGGREREGEGRKGERRGGRKGERRGGRKEREKGREEGREKGREEGREKGREEGREKESQREKRRKNIVLCKMFINYTSLCLQVDELEADNKRMKAEIDSGKEEQRKKVRKDYAYASCSFKVLGSCCIFCAL